MQGLEDVTVRSEHAICAVLDRCAMKTVETLMKKYSSRSHSVSSITMRSVLTVSKELTPEGADLSRLGSSVLLT